MSVSCHTRGRDQPLVALHAFVTRSIRLLAGHFLTLNISSINMGLFR